MKKLNAFLDKSPLWQIYIFGWGVSFYLIDGYLLEEPVYFEKVWKLSVLLGAVFGLMFLLSISMVRKSTKFWDYAKVLEELIDKAETKKELSQLCKNECRELIKLHQGPSHTVEVMRLKTKLETKANYIP